MVRTKPVLQAKPVLARELAAPVHVTLPEPCSVSVEIGYIGKEIV